MLPRIITLFYFVLICHFDLCALSNDGDPLSDFWEVTYGFSVTNHSPNPEELATADPDGDGKSNLEESIAGTDPYDASVFSLGSNQNPGCFNTTITVSSSNPDLLELSWWGIVGKYYRLELIDNLSAGTWNYIFSDPGAPLIFMGTDSAISYLIDSTNPLWATDKRFFRIEVFDQNTYNTALTDWEYLKFIESFVVSGSNDTDADTINDNEDAAPFDANVGQIRVSIHTPINGSTIQ